MVEIYMTLDGTPQAQDAIVELIDRTYGILLNAGIDDGGASLWLIDTGCAQRYVSFHPAPSGSGSVYARLDPGCCLTSDPDRIHDLIHSRMYCGAPEEVPDGGIAFIADPEYPLGQ